MDVMADGDQTHSSSFADSDTPVLRPRSFFRKLAFWNNRKRPPEREAPRVVVSNASFPNNVPNKHHPHKGYRDNKIRTTKYTLLTFVPKNLFEQFHRFANLYFILIVLLNWLPRINAFGKEIAIIPVVFVLGVTAIKDWFEDIRRYKSDKRVNNLTCRVYSREADRYVKKLWKEVHVGDFVHLSCNEVIPADTVLLRCSDEQGLCYIETANIDGESNLKQREVAKGFLHNSPSFHPPLYHCRIECDPPNHKIYRFNGCIVSPTGERVPISRENLLLRDCVLKNADFVEGIVVYAGHETKTMLNNGGPRYKRSKLEKLMNRDVIYCVFILLLLCFLGALGNGFWLSSFENKSAVPFLYFPVDKWYTVPEEAFFVFWRFVIVLQVMIPLSLYVTIEIIKLGQVYFIHQDMNLYDSNSNKRLECRALNIPEELGQVEYIFSDKTGTLTENDMVFRRCTIGGVDYIHQPPSSTSSLNGIYLYDKPSDSGNNKASSVIPNSELQEELSKLEIQLRVGSTATEIIHLSRNSQRIQDFFLLLAVCNTVVVSKYPHKDQMNSSGLCLNLSTPTIFRLRGNTESWNCPDEKCAHLLSYTHTPNTSTASTPVKRPHSLAIPNLGFSRIVTPSPTPTELRPIFEAESPDEIALVNAAFAYNCRLLRRTPDSVVLSLPGEGLIEFKVLHILPFDSTRKRMSIILEHPISGQKILYCKGADSTVLSQLAEADSNSTKEMIFRTQQHLNGYSRKGLRVLCMAKKVLSPKEYESWLDQHREAECSFDNKDKKLYISACRIETDLQLLGATGIEDKLQEGVPSTISSLREAGITVWVLTGDKQETAVNIAYSCQLFSSDMEIITLNARSKEAAEETMKFYLDQISRDITTENCYNAPFAIATDINNYLKSILFHTRRDTIFEISLRKKPRALVIDGRSLTFILDQSLSSLFLQLSQYCTSVLCCRATPLQKASVVRLIKETLNVKTLAIGDGANDVSMIQVADVGVGISGKEGMQAVMASDFALARFRYLERLLLVHGHWCYDRLARTVLYFFYKNASFIFIICWYQWFCGFSSMVMIDDIYLMLFNVLFISLPPIVMGIFDKDCPEDLLLRYPHLYAQGQKSEVHTKYSFWFSMLDAVYQSIVTFFIPFTAYNDTEVGIAEFGTTICTACVLVQLVHLAIETKSWTFLHILSILVSLLIYFGIAITYNVWQVASVSPFHGPYWVIVHAMGTPIFWLCIILVPILSCLPRLVLRALHGSLFPTQVTATLRHAKSYKPSTLSVSWSRESSDSFVDFRISNNRMRDNQRNNISNQNGAIFGVSFTERTIT